MAASRASIASSKLLNLRNPALQILLRRPSAAAAQSLNLLHPENITTSSPANSSAAINHNFLVSNLPLHFQLPIEAARGCSPTPPEDDDDYDVEDDEDEFDDEDDIEDLSGLEFEDDDGDEDDDDEIRRPIRK